MCTEECSRRPTMAKGSCGISYLYVYNEFFTGQIDVEALDERPVFALEFLQRREFDGFARRDVNAVGGVLVFDVHGELALELVEILHGVEDALV